MVTVFFATSNKGKQAEITRFAAQYGDAFSLRFPDKVSEIKVNESGSTFEENALLKAEAYQAKMKDETVVYVGDDSGVKILALDNKPGVFTRRWAGYEMTDQEIINYCIDQMKSLQGDDRKAVFETVLVTKRGNEEPHIYRGQMWGRILHKPIDAAPIEGFPFRSIFWVDELNCPIYKVHGLMPDDRPGFLTHREKALQQLFENLLNR